MTFSLSLFRHKRTRHIHRLSASQRDERNDFFCIFLAPLWRSALSVLPSLTQRIEENARRVKEKSGKGKDREKGGVIRSLQSLFERSEDNLFDEEEMTLRLHAEEREEKRRRRSSRGEKESEEREEEEEECHEREGSRKESSKREEEEALSVAQDILDTFYAAQSSDSDRDVEDDFPDGDEEGYEGADGDKGEKGGSSSRRKRSRSGSAALKSPPNKIWSTVELVQIASLSWRFDGKFEHLERCQWLSGSNDPERVPLTGMKVEMKKIETEMSSQYQPTVLHFYADTSQWHAQELFAADCDAKEELKLSGKGLHVDNDFNQSIGKKRKRQSDEMLASSLQSKYNKVYATNDVFRLPAVGENLLQEGDQTYYENDEYESKETRELSEIGCEFTFISLSTIVHPLNVVTTHRTDNAVGQSDLFHLFHLWLANRVHLSVHLLRKEMLIKMTVSISMHEIASPLRSQLALIGSRVLAARMVQLMAWACSEEFPAEINQRCEAQVNHHPQWHSFHLNEFYAASLPSKAVNVDEVTGINKLVQERGLVSELRPYQSKAVYWMMKREMQDDSEELLEEAAQYHWFECALYKKAHHADLGDFSCIWINTATGQLAFAPTFVELPSQVCGGILADQVGLGKTVECLSLVLACPATHKLLLPQEQSSINSTEDEVKPPSAVVDSKMPMQISCYCGNDSEISDTTLVKCTLCQNLQHVSCVSFDIDLELESHYVCPSCSAKEQPEAVKATIVCMPDVLLSQWKDECLKHIACKDLKILIYQGCIVHNAGKVIPSFASSTTTTKSRSIVGIRKDPSVNCKRKTEFLEEEDEKDDSAQADAMETCAEEEEESYIKCDLDEQDQPEVHLKPLQRPKQLQYYDLVLCAFSILRADFHFRTTHNSRGLRTKKYRVIDSPLRSALFHRVILDEAQMLKNGVSPAAAMVMQIPARARWCVSGTPVVRGLEDVRSLFSFLSLSPYNDSSIFKHIFGDGECIDVEAQRKLNALASRLMWRNTRESVKDELALPALSEYIHVLQFTPLEQFIYNELANTLAQLPTSCTSQKKLQNLSNSLLRLRQCCLHPQAAGQSQGTHSRRMVSIKKKPMTMEEVTEHLLRNARIEAEQSNRALIIAQHGLASLYMLKHQYIDAIVTYCNVLGLDAISLPNSEDGVFEEQVDQERGRDSGCLIAIDRLLECHALFNLAEASKILFLSEQAVTKVNERPKEVVERRILHLLNRVTSVKKGLTHEAELSMRAAADRWMATTNEVTVCFESLTEKGGSLIWLHSLRRFLSSSPHLEGNLLRRVKAAIQEANSDDVIQRQTMKSGSILHSFHDMAGLCYVLESHMKELLESRKKVIEGLQKFLKNQPPSSKCITLSVNCQKCRPDAKGAVCDHCKLETFIRVEETKLYRFTREKGMGSYIKTAKEVGAEDLILMGTTRNERSRLLHSDGVSPLELLEEEQEESQSKAASECELAMLAMQAYCRAMRHLWEEEKNETRDRYALNEHSSDGILQGIADQLAHLNACKKELVAGRHFSSCHRNQLSILDEIDQSCSRLMLVPTDVQYSNSLSLQAESKILSERWDDPLVQNHETDQMEIEPELHITHIDSGKKKHARNFIRAFEIPLLLSRYSNEKASASADLQKSLSNLRFLQSQSSSQKDQKQEDCLICQESLSSMKETVIFPCFHCYCLNCLNRLLRHSNTQVSCALCRRKCVKKDMIRVLNPIFKETSRNISSFASSINDTPTSAISTQSENSLLSLSSSSTSVSPSVSTYLPSLIETSGYRTTKALDVNDIAGSYGTKISSVCALCTRMIGEDRSTKILVFTNFDDGLTLLSRALRANDIHNLILLQRKLYASTIAQFNTDPSLSVLVMPLHTLNSGLNLTAANRIIIVEPAVASALERQCVGRVYRMGQTRPCETHRFCIAGTVEERLVVRNARHVQEIDESTSQAKQGSKISQAMSNLSEEELQNLVNPEARLRGAQQSSKSFTSPANSALSSKEDDKLDRAEIASDDEAWWAASVRFESRIMSRLHALAVMQRRIVLSHHPCPNQEENESAITDSFWHGRQVPKGILPDLLSLPIE